MKSSEQWSRRDILKIPGAGLMGAAAARAPADPEAPPLYRRRGGRKLYQPPTEPSTAALIKGNDRRENIYKSLKLIEDQVIGGIGDKQILIKPNFVQTSEQLAATHADAIRGILEFLRPHYKKEILIGEAAADQGRHHGRVRELRLPGSREGIQGQAGGPEPGRLSVPLHHRREQCPRADTDLLTLPGPQAVHHFRRDHEDARLRLGDAVSEEHAARRAHEDYKASDKDQMHRGPHGEPNDIIHFNMFHLAQEVYPDLAVIDGFTGMEGDGPSRGTPWIRASPLPASTRWRRMS